MFLWYDKKGSQGRVIFMESIWKKSVAAALAALVVLGAAGCGSGEKKAAVAKDTLKVGVNSFEGFLESDGNCSGLVAVRYGIGETLTRFDGKMAVKPWLAESWKIAGDKLSWTFRINGRAVFSNGNKVTGDAVASSLRRTFEKTARAKAMFAFESIKGEGQDVIIKTKRPVPNLPGMLGDPVFVISDTSVKDRDSVTMWPIGTGPYAVKSFNTAKAVLEANDKFWDGKVPFKQLEISVIDDPHTRAMALYKGEIDAAVNVASGDMALFKDTGKFTVGEVPSFRAVLARLSVKAGKPLSDKAVREALASALDRPTYCNVLLKGTFESGGPQMPPSADYGYDGLMKLDKNQYNVERARKLLAGAGWKDTNKDGFADKNGKNLELDFIFYSGLAELPLFAEATRADARQAGIKVNLKSVECNILDKLGTTGEYDMLISNTLTLQAGDPEVYMKQYWKTGENGGNPQNSSGYSNPKYDELSDRLAVEFDPAKRRQMVIDMQKIVLEDCATIVFGYPRTNIVSNTSIKNSGILPCDYYWVTKDWVPADAK